MFKASEKIDEKRNLARQLELKKAESTSVSRAESLAGRRLKESKELLESHINTMEYKKRMRLNADGDGDQDQLKRLEERHSEAERTHREASEAVSQWGEDVRALEAALLGLRIAVTPEDLADYQDKTASAQQSCDGIQALIDAQQAVIDKAKASMKPAPDFGAERQDLLADIAMGNASPADLEALEGRARKAREESEQSVKASSPVIESATSTLQGLARKLADARAILDNLKGRRVELILAYLETEAEKEGAEYIRLASDLMGHYKRMLAIDAMRKSLGADSFKPFSIQSIHIPAFNIRPFNVKRKADQPPVLHEGQYFGLPEGLKEIERLSASEWEKIKAVGEYLA